MKSLWLGIMAMLNDELFWLLIILAVCAWLAGIIYG